MQFLPRTRIDKFINSPQALRFGWISSPGGQKLVARSEANQGTMHERLRTFAHLGRDCRKKIREKENVFARPF